MRTSSPRIYVLARFALPLGILGACYWLQREQLNALSLDTVCRAIREVSFRQLVVAAVATAGSYCSLAVLERVLFNTAGVHVRWRRALMGSFIANSVSASVGLVLASAALLRLRIYGRWSVATRDVLYVSLAFAPIVIMSGLLGACLAILFELREAQRFLSVGPTLTIGVAVLLALPTAAFLAVSGGLEVGWRQHRFVFPNRAQRLLLVVAGLSDWASASYVLFAVAGIAVAAYPWFLLHFIFGWLFGAASGLPAGTGLIDATMMRGFSSDGNVPQLAAGLLLFRVIYFAVPALVALVLLTIAELRGERD
jgi:uncharacterized membrane protein YbhN (UPF0104 family)